MMKTRDYGVKVRDYYIVVGYFGKYLVAIDEHNQYYVTEEDMHLFEVGTICDEAMFLKPAEQLPEDMYKEFVAEFGRGTGYAV